MGAGCGVRRSARAPCSTSPIISNPAPPSSALKAGKPQIFNLDQSKPQVLACQDARLAAAPAFLDRLWTDDEGVCDPDLQVTYGDRGARATVRRATGRVWETRSPAVRTTRVAR